MILRLLLTVALLAPSLALAQAPGDLPPKAPADTPDGPPVVSAKAWVVADGATGKVLWAANDAESRPMASTTKIATAWLVLRLANKTPAVLDETVTFSERAARTVGTSSKLQAGDKLPVRDLLYGLMLPSGNDAAVSLAEHFGPRFKADGDAVAAFVAELNRLAGDLGLKETAYSDPNGLSRDNRASARDLAKLAATTMADVRFRGYVATRRHACFVTNKDGQEREVVWTNTNKLLDIDGYDGVKTGTTTPAGNCLVASGRRGTQHLIVVVLGASAAEGRYVDSRNLFRWAWQQRASSVPRPLDGAILVVDPGHGGQRYSKSYTGGTRGVTTKQTESELNLRVGLELAKRLRELGATVHLTREADHRLSPEGSSNSDELHTRIDYFEHHAPHFFLSVHHNATDDKLYEALAKDVNDALEGALPGPKRKLIKDNYHILRETPIPGTIAESGFLTNEAFDALAARPDFPKVEAEAIAKGAVKYWTDHRVALVALREQLIAERAARPRDPNTVTAIALNPKFQARTNELLAKVAPGGRYDPADVAKYVAAFRTAVVTDPKAKFTVTGEYTNGVVRLSGETSDRAYHDRLIDMLVAMKIYAITNEVRLP